MACVHPAILFALLCYRVLSAKGYLRLIMKIMTTIIKNTIITIPKNKPGIIIPDSERRNLCVRLLIKAVV
jgi:hypothetical protein